jgi:regulator of replication initiation timing
MNRLEFLAKHGSPEQIIEEVTTDIVALQKIIQRLMEENTRLKEEIAKLEDRNTALHGVLCDVY